MVEVLAASLFAVMGIVLSLMWLKNESFEDDIEYRLATVEDIAGLNRREIAALREAHLAKVKKLTSSLKSQHTINDIFIQLLRDKTFVVVEDAPRRAVRRKTKRRKR